MGLPYGPVRCAFVGPKTLTTGLPSATAMCIEPESFVTQAAERRTRAIISANVV